MTRYEIIKFFHIVAVIVWVGGGVMEQAQILRASRTNDPKEMAAAGRGAAWASQRVFMPASFVALGFGIWLVVDGPWSFGDPWIGIGMAGFVLSAVIGMAVLGRLSKRIDALTIERGPQDPVVQHTRRRLVRASRIDMVILVAVVFDMVVKPGT